MNDPNILIKSPTWKPEDVTIDTLHKLSENSLPIWCLTNKVQVDHKLIDFNKHRYALPWYLCNDEEVALVKASQIGASIWAFLRLLWFLEQNQGTKAALYLPNESVALSMSQDRLEPL